MKLRAVCFDLGGVILRTEDRSPRTELAQGLGMTYETLERVVHGGGPDGSAARAALGRMTEAQHWLSVAAALHLPASEIPRVESAYFAGDRLDQNLLEFMRSLRPQYKVGLISNAWSGLREWIIDRQFDDVFDDMTISAEVGAMKPDVRIYQHALTALGVRPAEAVFIDDVPENVAGADALGMRGVLFRESGQVIDEINRLLAA